MLADWYFCCCIKASPSTTKAFLSILEVLENPESDAQLLYLAYDELRRTDIWMQVYALPQVLQSLHKQHLTTAINKTIIVKYFEDLIDNLPKTAEETFKNLLLGMVLEKAEPVGIIKTLTEGIKVSQRYDSEIRTPYLDLKEFLAETLMMAVIANQLENNTEFAIALDSELEKEESPLKSLLENSLNYKFGRLAFRLAVIIYDLTKFKAFDDLISRIGDTPFSTASLEPDLLETSAYILIQDNLRNNDKNTVVTVKKIIQESLTLENLRRLKSSKSERQKYSHTEDFIAPVQRIVENPNQDLCNSLSIIYWQSVLWELAARLDSTTTAEELAKFWQPPTELPSRIKIGSPYRETSEKWKQQLESLMNVRNERIFIEVEKKEIFSLPEESKWIFGSPWIRRLRDRTYKDKLWYPTADTPENLVRLIVGSCVAIKLLQTKNQAHSVELSKLIAHASDVIEKTYANWFKNYNKDKNERKNVITQITLPLTGLALFGKRQINLVGTGKLESISPNSFVEILRNCHDLSNDKSDEKDFLELVLPEVLMSWITDAYINAVGQNGSKRWLNLIPEVYDFHKKGNPEDTVKQKAGLVMRFLCPEQFKDDETLDWRKKIKGNTWRIHHRWLLLTLPKLPPEEWHKPTWDETQLDSSGRLVRALERLSALSLLPDGDSIPEDMQGWQSEWEDCLNKVSKSVDLDRFIHLRLLELLENNLIIGKAPEAQRLIICILLEYGYLYDLERMIFWVDVTNPGAELQEIILQAMHRFLIKQNSANFLEVRNQRSVQDPVQTHIYFQKFELFQARITKAIYLSVERRNQRQTHILKTIYQRYRESSITTNLRVKYCDIEVQNTRKQIIQSKNDRVADWAIQAVVYNPNKFTATIFYNDFDLTGIINLFESSEKEIENLKNSVQQTFYVLAVVVGVKHFTPERAYYTFNCGLYFYLNCNINSQNQSYKIGDYVGLNLQYKDRNWTVNTEDSIRPLQQKLKIGDIDCFKIIEYRIPGDKKRRLRVFCKDELIIENPEDLFWDADISRRFQEFPRQDRLQVFAQYAPNNKWIPIDRDFQELLLNAFDDLNSNITVLCLIGEVDGEFGKKAWRFSIQPGENYILEQDQFVENDGKALEEKIANLDKESNQIDKRSPGLLIAVQPVIQNDIVYLSLVDNKLNNTNLDIFYPNLQMPFDERNIEWRELFNDSQQDYIAEKEEDGNWYYKLESNQAIGYPQKVNVSLQGIPHNYKPQYAEFIVDKYGWDWRTPKVSGEHIPSNTITLAENEDWQEFIAHWLNIKEGDRILIKTVVGKVNRGGSGFIPCLTKEGIFVQVEAESLTMKVLQDGDRLNLNSRREAEVIKVNWSQKSVEINDQNIPPAAIVNRHCEGIFIQVPKGERGNICQLIWQTNAEPIPGSLWIENIWDLHIRPGSKIFGKQTNDKWEFYIESRTCLVRGLWKKTELQSKNKNLSYLGIPEGYRQAIAQSQPGEFVFLTQKQEKVNHLATIDHHNNFKNGINLGSRTKNTSSGNSWPEQGYKWRRAVLTLHQNELLIGNCSDYIGNDNLSLTNVVLTLIQKSDGLFELRRELRLKEVRQTQRINDHQETDTDDQKWQNNLNQYWESPYDLDATFNPGDRQIKLKKYQTQGEPIQILNSAINNWTFVVPLAPNEEAYVAEGRYSSDVKVRLFKNEQNHIRASFRQVPPATPDEFKRELGAGFNHLFELEPTKLYYVGIEETKTENTETVQIKHRFEMGYGKTLVVPESQLKYENRSFKRTELLIFHGDLITHITFLPNEIEQQNGCIINIDKVNIQFSSEGRSLYNQRKKYQIVHILHVLHLRTVNNRIEVTSVDGFHDTSTDTDQTKQSFNRVRAKLTPESEKRLLSRLQETADNSPQKYVIYGRLDVNRYEYTLGEEILFDHVRLSFESAPEEPSPLENNEMVFMQANTIIEGENDMSLKLSLPEMLTKKDIGADLNKQISLQRRQFSVRENLLARFSDTEDGKSYFEGHILLVRLRKFERGKPVPSLIKDPPFRKTSVLNGVIDSSSDLALASVHKISDQNQVSIELKPGIFVNLEPENIETRPKDLTEGAIVRIQKIFNPDAEDKSYRFRISFAAFSDLRYVPNYEDGVRPVVTLPKNHLFDPIPWEEEEVKNNAYWQGQDKRNSFTIGGLPNIQASPGWYYQTKSTWRQPRANNFIELMQKRHPKIVCLGIDDQGFARITPQSLEFYVGRLFYTRDRLNVKYIPLGKKTDDSTCCELSWLELSFGDESVEEIIARARMENWRYHDRSTRTWSAEDGEFKLKELKDPHNINTGPLFFQSHRNNLRLRYTTKNELLRFGFPVDELISALKQKPSQSATYPVAGISDKEGLWIELAPGRVVELPAQLVVTWKTEKSLAKLNWKNFAPGDRVELQVVASNRLEIEKVALKKWISGPRKAFGKKRCFLPVQPEKSKKGAIALGYGLFTLTLPFTDDTQSWKIAILTPDNRLVEINEIPENERQPVRGDTVFLSINKAGEFILLGLETLTANPIDAIAPEELKNLLQAVDNALPVTVERVSEGRLSFSTKLLDDAANLPIGRITFARVVGILPDKRTAVLQSGSGLIEMPLDEIVSGLPQPLFAAAAEKLKNSQDQQSIGLRAGDRNKPKVGLEEESSQGEIWVEAVDTVSVNDNGQEKIGLICRSIDSMALYWLPAEEAAFTKLSLEGITEVFLSKNQRKFPVKVNRKTGYVSVLEVQEVQQQFRDLKIGEELTVKVIIQEKKSKRSQRYLVESFTTKVILECETYDDEILSGEILVEVIRRSQEQKSIAVVPAGKKRQSLDLPQWMTNSLPNPGEQRQEFNNYLKWCHEEKDKKPNLNDEKNLARLLCYVYYDAFDVEKDKYPRFQLEVAKAWIEKNLSAPEINVALALMAILVLQKNNNRKEDELIERLKFHRSEVKIVVRENQKLACQMTQNLGQRALRSMHVEVLQQNWLNNNNRNRRYGIWQRLQQIDSELRSRQKVEKLIGTIRQFCDAVELRSNETDILSISDGLSAALGELSSISTLTSTNAEVTQKLIQIYRTLPITQSGYQVPLTDWHINRIHELFQLISVNKLDITLLEPLEVYKSQVYRYESRNLLLWLEDWSESQIKKISQQLYVGNELSQYRQKIEPGLSKVHNNFQRILNLLEE